MPATASEDETEDETSTLPDRVISAPPIHMAADEPFPVFIFSALTAPPFISMRAFGYPIIAYSMEAELSLFITEPPLIFTFSTLSILPFKVPSLTFTVPPSPLPVTPRLASTLPSSIVSTSDLLRLISFAFIVFLLVISTFVLSELLYNEPVTSISASLLSTMLPAPLPAVNA